MNRSAHPSIHPQCFEMLQVTIFETSISFASTLHQHASRNTKDVFGQKSVQQDEFLPGYSSGVKRVLQSVGITASTSDPANSEQDVKIEEKPKEDRNGKKDFNSNQSGEEFIDDKEASEDEEYWNEEDDSPPPKQRKSRGRKTTSSIVKKWNEWAELLINDDDRSDRFV